MKQRSFGSVPFFPIFPNHKKIVTNLLNEAYSQLSSLAKEVFSHPHTVGDSSALLFRKELLRSMKRIAIPW